MTRLGVDRPLASSPRRAPGSLRRTSYIDIVWLPQGDGTPLLLRAGARDVATDDRGEGELLDHARLNVWLDRMMRVRRIEADPPVAGLDALVGLPCGRGFRAAARAAVGAGLGRPLDLLLDDVPVAALISGYAPLRSGELSARDAGSRPTVLAMRDLCSGWRDGGTMMTSIDGGGGVPVPDLAAAPPLDLPADPLAGDPPEALPGGSLRRRRRIDILGARPDGTTPIEATFRDTFAGPDGAEGTLHEYLLFATVDAGGRLATISAEPRVLPWPECPAAAAGPARLIGRPIGELGAAAPTGVESCTHLNDLIRSLADVGRLIDRCR